MNVMNARHVLLVRLACSSAVLHLAVPGTTRWSRRTSSSCETPGFAATEIAVKPFMCSSVLRVGIVKTANVAPPSDVDVAVLRDADDLERSVGPARRRRRCESPTREVLVLRRVRVDHDLVRRRAPSGPRSSLQRVEARLRRVDAEAERRVAVARRSPCRPCRSASRCVGVAVEVDDRAARPPATSGCLRIFASSCGEPCALPLDE